MNACGPAPAFFLVLVATAAAGDIPRTHDGNPDLSGVWDFRTLTPLQRPEEFGDKAVLTVAEALEIETKSTEAAVQSDKPSEASLAQPLLCVGYPC